MMIRRIPGMRRYFFHLHNDIDAPDEEGQEHANDHAAMEAALKYARDMASVSDKRGHLNLAHSIVCVDEIGQEVGIVRFGDAVAILGG